MWDKDNGFQNNTIEAIEKIASERKVNRAMTNHDENTVTTDSIRSSQVAWLTDLHWIRDYLYQFVKQGNREAFGVSVENLADIQYTEYHASEGDHYDWHTDVFWDQQRPWDRKLSITVQLSDSSEYDGGEFEFNECETPTDSKEKGTVLMFPSYLQHRVTPITAGVRKSLVAWFEGPRWK